MDKINTALLWILVLVLIVGCIYEFMYISELKRDMIKLSESVQELRHDNGMLQSDIGILQSNIQDVKQDIKSINQVVNLILGQLWLECPPQLESPEPLPIGLDQ